MLSFETVLSSDGIEVADVACSHRAGRGAAEGSPSLALVFVRRGSFVRSANGCETMLDPTVAYAMNPDEEQRYDHHNDAGADCTALFLSAEVVGQAWGGFAELPTGPLPTLPAIDLEHRLLLSSARRAEDPMK